jgi:hypothetical protein
MSLGTVGLRVVALGVLSLLLFSPTRLLGQTPSGTLRGQVSDPSGASVPGAGVAVVSSTGQSSSGVANEDGSYEIRGLAPGKYTVRAVGVIGSPLFGQSNSLGGIFGGGGGGGGGPSQASNRRLDFQVLFSFLAVRAEKRARAGSRAGINWGNEGIVFSNGHHLAALGEAWDSNVWLCVAAT